MLELLDFDSMKDAVGYGYGGATGPKAPKMCNGLVTIIKRQEKVRDNQYDTSYVNDPLSEYIGSHIYEILGVPVHQTRLGMYKGRMAVGCVDFSAYTGKPLVEFRYLKNTIVSDDIEYDVSGMSRDLENILKSIDILFNGELKDKVLNRFYTMFVVDSLIGNADRNNGNWGFFREADGLTLAPVYDCGSCLNYRRPDSKIREDVNDEERMRNLALIYTFNFRVNGKLINPFHCIERNLDNKYIVRALDMVCSIDENKVIDLIDTLDNVCSSERMFYYKRILVMRLAKLRNIQSSNAGGGSKLSSLFKNAEGY